MSQNKTLLKLNGKDVSPEQLFTEAEKLFCKKSHIYLDSLLPLAEDYCGKDFTEKSVLLTLGMLMGIILEKKKISVVLQEPMDSDVRDKILRLTRRLSGDVDDK